MYSSVIMKEPNNTESGGVFFDKNGEYINCDWNKKYVGITYNQIKKTPVSIGFGFNEVMTDCLLAAVKGGLINVLITNVLTANPLIVKHKKNKQSQNK